MLRLVIMPLANKRFVLSLVSTCALAVALASGAQAQQQSAPPSTNIGSQEPQQPPVMSPPTPQQAPAPAQNPPQQAPANPRNQPGNTAQVPNGSQQRGAAVEQENGGFVIRVRSTEVTLHATVVDDRDRLITGLDKNAFHVYENGQPQTITSFRQEDVPVALGILIDNSGSMREKRPAVNQAALNLVKASNPKDEVFIVNFNEDYYLDQDYTSSVPQLKEALERIESRGGTALYDALVASADHLMKSARLDKKALLVITDGADNASRESLDAAVRRIAVDGGPTVYTIGILSGDEGHREEKTAKRALRMMAEQTGGVYFFPRDFNAVDSITQQVAHDIRSQYSIGYRPSNPQTQGGYRTVKVEAEAKGYKKLQVRTRTGYYAGQEQASASAQPAQ